MPVSTAEAALTKKQQQKEKRFLRQLKKLPRNGARPGKTRQYTLRLVKLNPRKSKQYYKIATLRIASAFIERVAGNISRKIQNALSKSDLPRSVERRLANQVRRIERRIIQFNEPTPTPSGPYQAQLRLLPGGLEA